MRILEKEKEKEKRAEDNPSQQVHPRAESRQSIVSNASTQTPYLVLFFFFFSNLHPIPTVLLLNTSSSSSRPPHNSIALTLMSS